MDTCSVAKRTDVKGNNFIIFGVKVEDCNGQCMIELFKLGDLIYSDRKIDALEF